MARSKLQYLSEPMYYILLSLKEPNYGYQIMQTVDEITEGRIKVGPGTLYSLLSRFEKENIVEILSIENKKKIYGLTEYGEKVLSDELSRLRTLVLDGERIIGGGCND